MWPSIRFTDDVDLNRQALEWCDTVANARVHGTTYRIPWEMLAEEGPYLGKLPGRNALAPYLREDRKVVWDGFVSSKAANSAIDPTSKGGTDRMSGRQPFGGLTKDFTPERRQRIEALKNQLLSEMPLHELRRARALTQRDLADKLKVNQFAVSKLEQRADVYVCSLRSYIEAVEGRLKIVAEFLKGAATITIFSDLGEDEEA